MQPTIETRRQLRQEMGRNLLRLRAERHVTLRQLSILTGISEYKLDRYEMGRHEIRLQEMLKIASALKVRVDALMQ